MGSRSTDPAGMGRWQMPLTRHRGVFRFSVVSAVWNVSAYLDDYFTSLVGQSLDFRHHLEVILVDDGSTDNSVEILRDWQTKYPDNVRFVHQPNCGQASARNRGLRLATGDFVTFIDPDDFVDRHYFAEVDRFLRSPEARDVALLCCPLIFYYDGSRRFADRHPLRGCFSSRQILSAGDLGRHVQLSAASAFFRRSLLNELQLEFSEQVKPNFEDAHLVARYLLAIERLHVAVLPSARYYYRKRAEQTSTVDRSWSNPVKYTELPELGYLSLLREAESRLGQVPQWLQRTVLYDLIWYFKRLVNHSERLPLTSAESLRFRRTVETIVGYIDRTTIVDFELAGTWFYHKVGLLGLRHEDPPTQIAYVHRYDTRQGLLLVRYFFAAVPPAESCQIDGVSQAPVCTKTARDDFLGHTFVHERLLAFSVPPGSSRLLLRLGDQPARLSVRGRQLEGEIAMSELARLLDAPAGRKARGRLHRVTRALKSLARMPLSFVPGLGSRLRNAWILMDQRDRAGGNAEQLYRHLLATLPRPNAYFVLARDSADWERLESEGFRLLAHGSLVHRLALLHAAHLVSSESRPSELCPLSAADRERTHYRFTFLGAGVLQDDRSEEFNQLAIDCLVVSTLADYSAVAGDYNRYRLSTNEVCLTGMPLHDALLANRGAQERLILVVPAMRPLATPTTATGRLSETLLSAYDYAKGWLDFLGRSELRGALESNGFALILCPPEQWLQSLPRLKLPDWVQIGSTDPESARLDLIRRAALLVTDVSPLTFDMALLHKPSIYYDFAVTESLPRHFDHERDGFGPVCRTASDVIAALGVCLDRGTEPSYHARMQQAIVYRDGRNCERVLQAILRLDHPVAASDEHA